MEPTVLKPSVLLPLIAATSLLSGCEPAGVACTLEFIPSTRVTVVDPRGEVVDDARVTFTHDDGASREASCATPSLVKGSCMAWETPDLNGTYVLRATSADGQRSVQQQVEVAGDLCHVDGTVAVQLVLPD